jgi:hypothetical protein
MRAHTARVRWRPPSERGTAQLPATLRYLALSRFAEDSPTWPDGAWTVELSFTEPPAEQLCDEGYSMASVRFLFDDAPHDRLVRGRSFAIYEGPTVVADVDIMD